MKQQIIAKGTCMELLGGTKIIVNDLISSGAQADVYDVIDVNRKTHVAMKHLYGHYAVKDYKKLYYDKCRIMTQYHSIHPDLAWPYDISQPTSNDNFFFVMERLDGYTNVSQAIKNPSLLTQTQKAQLCLRLAEIILTLQKNGFVYGDISGKNTLFRIDTNGNIRVKLIDCDNLISEGTSKQHPKGFNLGLTGTGLYRAPEIISGKAVPNRQSDLHSLAVTCFRVFMQRHPLDGNAVRAHMMSSDTTLEYFGKHPHFIFDGNENTVSSQAVISRWNALPRPMKLYFTLIFNQEHLLCQEPRLEADILIQLLKRSFPNVH